MVIYTESDQFGQFHFAMDCASDSPTTSPTTPSPTTPSNLTCDSVLTGDYNDELIVFTAELPFDGDFLFRALIDSVAGSSLVVRDGNGLVIASDGDQGDPDGAVDGQRIVERLAAGTYSVELDADPGTVGQFEVELECSSSAPTSEPTLEPTMDSLVSTTEDDGSVLQCDDFVEGDYVGDLVVVDVYIPYDGDMTFYALINGDQNTPRILIIRDAAGTIIAADGDSADPDGVTDGDRTVEGLSAGNYTVEFDSNTAPSPSTFVVGVDCTSNEPTTEPTKEPTTSPVAISW